MQEIKLFNRDGANMKLVSEDGNKWIFDIDKQHEYIFDYCRVGYDGDKIKFIDPSGGPMLSCGQRLDKYHVIDKFEFDKQIVIYTKNSEV